MQKQGQHTYQALWDIVNRLRAPGGCPWDREQTHQSLRRNLLEECYEASKRWTQATRSHWPRSSATSLCRSSSTARSPVTTARSRRTTCSGTSAKSWCDDTPVFGDVTVRDAREVESNWEETKRQERGDAVSALDGVAKGMPALGLRAGDFQPRRARGVRVG